MNKQLWSAVCAWMVLPMCMAQAQAPDAEAIERAQRDADNPLRLIIEAGKIKPRARLEADARAEPRPESKAAAGRPATLAEKARPPAPEPMARDVSPEATRAAALESVRALPAPAAVEVPDAPPAGAPSSIASVAPPPAAAAIASAVSAATNPPALPTMGADRGARAPAAAAPEPAAAPAEPAAASSETALVALAAVSPAPPASPPAALELLSSVQPELPERILRRMRRDGEVLLVFKVETDGTVVDLNVQSSTDVALDPIALDAVRQWRYKPIAEPRMHRLQLVFKRE